LISDPDKLLCEAFSVWVDKSMYGRTYKGVERSTFVIGPDGSVEREWRKVTADGHAAEVLAALS
jgi:peroxiredoxin Q/BCP